MIMIRIAKLSDISQLLAIEQQAQVVPWIEETFKLCFQSGYQAWVIEKDKKILGFVIISIHSEECHILNLCVLTLHQHQGWGRSLLQHALIEAQLKGAKIAYLEVRVSNTRAISLYQKMNFVRIGERKAYYDTIAGKEDALIYAKILNQDDFTLQ